MTRERKTLDVSIEKGMHDGQRITFSGEGDQKPGLEMGDVVVVLDEKEHPVFMRKGVNIFTKMPISLSEALTGLRRTVKTLDGRTLVILTESGEVLRNGEVRCVSGEGMPTYRSPFKKGKLMIQFSIHFPARLKPAVAESLAKILPPKEEPVIPEEHEEVEFDEDDEDEEDEDGEDDEDENCNGPGVGCATQ